MATGVGRVLATGLVEICIENINMNIKTWIIDYNSIRKYNSIYQIILILIIVMVLAVCVGHGHWCGSSLLTVTINFCFGRLCGSWPLVWVI
jgi:hypothetical protein